MAVLDREAFMQAIKERIGDDTSDECLAFVQSMSETYDSLSQSNAESWKEKYEKNDREWREKYKSAFFSGAPEPPPEEGPAPTKEYTYEALFKSN